MGRIVTGWVRPLAFAGLLLVSPAFAQPQPSPQPDPATALLMSQPQIDITSPVVATASFDPPRIRPGETAIYRVTFSAMNDSVHWPDEIIAPSALTFEFSARGQVFTVGGTGLQPRTAINHRVQAGATGFFTVPRFIVHVGGQPVTVPAATLNVVQSGAAAELPRQLRVELAETNPFVGQLVTARVILPGREGGVVQAIQQMQLNGDGLIVETGATRQRIENGTFTQEIPLTPIKAGRITLRAQGFTAGNQFSGPIVITGQATIPGGPPELMLLDSDPVMLNVRPLPRGEELPGFTGGIGSFKLDPPALATNVLRVGEPVTLAVNVRGEGNLTRLVAPPPPRVRGWQVFAGAKDTAPTQLVQARGFATFSYTLIPTGEETRATPEIPFCYFNPAREVYVNLSVPPVAVTVKPGVAPVDAAALEQAEGYAPSPEKEPRLSGLAMSPGRTMKSLVPLQQRGWFPLVQLTPALFFAALWWWDRRRRYLAAHPEILLRRRARRALHREWAAVRQAASLGDTPRFAACAARAMRVACAPHYPAEPRALVSSDVLPLLSGSSGSASEAVRRIFAAADADRFAPQAAEAKDLLALRPELEQVLAQLEEKLR
jgi:hypothetical protein